MWVVIRRLACEPMQRFGRAAFTIGRVVDGFQRQVVGVEDTAPDAQLGIPTTHPIGEEVLPLAGWLLLTEAAVAVE